MRELPSAEVLTALFDYDLKAGTLLFAWGVKRGQNAVHDNVIQILGTSVSAARVAWKIGTGFEPTSTVVFRDGDHENLRLDNLVCEAPSKAAIRYKTVPISSSTGVRGVSWHAQRKRWRARIFVDGQQISLGMFDNFEQAVAARYSAEVAYFR